MPEVSFSNVYYVEVTFGTILKIVKESEVAVRRNGLPRVSFHSPFSINGTIFQLKHFSSKGTHPESLPHVVDQD